MPPMTNHQNAMRKTSITVTFDHRIGEELIHHVIIAALQQIDHLDHIPDLAYCEVPISSGRTAVITGTVDDEHG